MYLNNHFRMIINKTHNLMNNIYNVLVNKIIYFINNLFFNKVT